MPIDLDPTPTVLLSGWVGGPGDPDGRSVVVAAAGLERTGVLRIDGGRSPRLWFDRGRPTFGAADGLLSLDARLEQEVCAERFAAAERRARHSGRLAGELVASGVPARRVTEELRQLVLDVLRITIGTRGPYRFERRDHPYTGPGWVRLDDVARPVRPTIAVGDDDTVALHVTDPD